VTPLRWTVRALFAAVWYYWRLSRGHRLLPWRSPYIRWRLHTAFGGEAEDYGPREMLRALWTHREAVLRASLWAWTNRHPSTGHRRR